MVAVMFPSPDIWRLVSGHRARPDISTIDMSIRVQPDLPLVEGRLVILDTGVLIP